MNLDYLAEFAEVANEESMSKAALRLSISQPCLSRHIKSLEQQLGVRLLDRHSSGVRLTEEGKYAFNRAVDMMEIADELEFHFGHARKDLTVGGLTVITDAYDAIAAAAAAQGRKASLTAKEPLDGGRSFIERLRRGDIDAYMTMDPSIETDAAESYAADGVFACIPLVDSPLVAVMEGENALASRNELKIEDLDGQLMLHAQSDFDNERVNWSNTKKLLRSSGIDYRSKSCNLEGESDLLADFRSGVLPFPEGYSGVPMLKAVGKSVIPVAGQYKRIVAYCRSSDKQTKLILENAASDLTAS